MRAWTVASAVIESSLIGPTPVEGTDPAGGAEGGEAASVLLVRNLRRNGTADWTPPGGVVDAGETPLDGLAREVAEETGLVVTGWSGLLYEIHAEAPDLGWDLRVEVHRAAAVEGDLAIGADPDGIVIGSEWAATPDCVRLLGDSHPWVREPLLEWLDERWVRPRTYRYLIGGASLEEITVRRR